MNRDQAKLLLRSYRGDQDKEDPRFAKALLMVEQDPELKEWFTHERAFDAAMAAHVQGVPVPPDLKRNVLARGPRPIWIWRWPIYQWRPALAAGLALLVVAAVGLGMTTRPPRFKHYCGELALESWNLPGHAHVQFESTNLLFIRNWLRAHDVPADFTVPAPLRKNAKLRGCGFMESHGQKIPVLCMLEGKYHMHLLVTENMEIAKGPTDEQPLFQTYPLFNMASWKIKDRTYFLAGLPSGQFVQRFRQPKHWNFDG